MESPARSHPYAAPRSKRVIGRVKPGTVVQALLGETIVVHPFRLVAAHDYTVGTGESHGHMQIATMHNGDVFWVLDSGNEGEFSIWWHGREAGWDSTEPGAGDQDSSAPLNTNEERWVKIRDRKTGLTGWFPDVEPADGPWLIPAHATAKATG